MKRLLIVEDQAADLHIAAAVAQSLGISEVEARTSAGAAKRFLEDGLDKKVSLPEAIVLDLSLGYESGFELLRFWHGTPELAKIRLIVWSIMAEEQQELCRLFKVDAVVPKWQGEDGLKQALGGLISDNS